MIKKSKVMKEIVRLKQIHKKRLDHAVENSDDAEFNEYYKDILLIEHEILAELEYLEERIFML